MSALPTDDERTNGRTEEGKDARCKRDGDMKEKTGKQLPTREQGYKYAE